MVFALLKDLAETAETAKEFDRKAPVLDRAAYDRMSQYNSKSSWLGEKSE